MDLGIGRRLFPRIALSDKRHFDGRIRDSLNLFHQRGDLRAFLFVGGHDDHGQQLAQRIKR